MISGVIGGLLLWAILIGAVGVGVRAAVRSIRSDREILERKQSDMIRKAVDGSAFTEPTHSMRLEPWTPEEREAFGVNETDRLIARIDAELMTPEESTNPNPAPPLESFIRDRDGVWIQR